MKKFFNKIINSFREKNDMIMVCEGTGKNIHYPTYMDSSSCVEWRSRDENSMIVRQPEETNRIYDLGESFVVGKREYESLEDLYVETDESCCWCQDVYGQKVLYLRERFPCFDSEDYLTEKRKYRWFFLRENNQLHRVFFADDSRKIYVTEDVKYLEDSCLEQMKEIGYVKMQV